MGDLLTTKEAAERLGRSREFVRGLLDDGQLAYIRHRGRRYIPAHALARLLAGDVTEPEPRIGRPVKRGGRVA